MRAGGDLVDAAGQTVAGGKELGHDSALMTALAGTDAILQDLPGGRHAGPFELTPPVGLSALDATTFAADASGVHEVGPSAAARLVPPQEKALDVVGRGATWCQGGRGPVGLHQAAGAELCGALFEKHVGLTRQRALVIPDSSDELYLANLHRRVGRAWTIWTPVAAMLRAADDLPERLAHPENQPATVLVVVLTDASLDVAILEQAFEAPDDPASRFWIRSLPLAGDRRGRHALRLADEDDIPVGPLLRGEPKSTGGWDLVNTRLEPITLPPHGAPVAATVITTVGGWRGPAASHVVTVGLDDADASAIAAHLPDCGHTRLDAGALAEGARTFLERHEKGLPTWKDRMPGLVVIARQDARRLPIPIVEEGRLVSPGETVEFESSDAFDLPLSEHLIKFKMQRQDRDAPYVLLLEGPPLPLRRPVRVRIEIRFVYGLDGVEGALVPVDGQELGRLPFRLEATAGGDEVDENPVPTLPTPEPLEKADIEQLHKAAKAIASVAAAARKARGGKSRSGPDPMLSAADEALRVVEPAAKRIRAAGNQLDADARRLIESELVPPLEWLLGLGRLKGAGSAPELPKRDLEKVARLRSLLRARGDGAFAGWLCRHDNPLAETERLRAIGLIIDGVRDSVWVKLRYWPVAKTPTAGAWARAIGIALGAAPEMVATMPEAEVEYILDRLLTETERASHDPGDATRYKQALFYLFRLVPYLCGARASGVLAPNHECVRDAVARLENVRATLPDEVRRYGENTAVTARDEPISVAIDYLRGDYTILPSVEAE